MEIPEVFKPIRKYFKQAEEMMKQGELGAAYACNVVSSFGRVAWHVTRPGKMHALTEGMKIMKQSPRDKVHTP